MRSLEPFDWWFTGLRREQSPTRAGLKKVEDHTTPTGKQMKKVSVLADWDWARVTDVCGARRDSAARSCTRADTPASGASRARRFQRRARMRAAVAGVERSWSAASTRFRRRNRRLARKLPEV